MRKPPCSPLTLSALLRLSRGAGIHGHSPPALAPFLCPSSRRFTPTVPVLSRSTRQCRSYSTPSEAQEVTEEELDNDSVHPVPPHQQQYNDTPFTDLISLTLQSGNGGHGCISFLREKYVDRGPPNGGNGGRGGSIYIQAIYGETTSLHKLGRQGTMKGGDGRNGQGKSRNGEKGDDIIIRVPVGAVVREIERWDPSVVLEEDLKDYEGGELNVAEEGEEELGTRAGYHGSNDMWIHYPMSEDDNLSSPKFQAAKYPTQHHLSSANLLKHTHPMPVNIDLSKPTPVPILLLPGAPGGLGNPHFITQKARAPKYATRGGKGSRMKISLELKILADVGLVGLPNAGKSSFLRAVSRRKAKVGEWAFTTLSPNIGTVAVDPLQSPAGRGYDGGPRERFTIADIPGLIADAHLNKGLGHGFLRHVERAKVLAFVIDLSRPDPLGDLKALWKEVKAYEEGWGDDKMAEKMGGAGMGMLGEMAGNKAIDPDLPLDDDEATLLKQATSEKNVDGEKESASGVLYDITDSAPASEEVISTGGNDEEMVLWRGTQASVPKHSASEFSFSATAPITQSPVHDPATKRNKISLKPWFIIANKADLKGTEKRFLDLRNYVKQLEESQARTTPGSKIAVVPVSAMKGEGVTGAVDVMKALLNKVGNLDDHSNM
ncbi:P-loop containing nucleoside triphosphate hydrolase protein [Peziza echinospora]|nr:P-loop containing nucleoside triphosphate hydrolase protein [Peziza echinospora]